MALLLSKRHGRRGRGNGMKLIIVSGNSLGLVTPDRDRRVRPNRACRQVKDVGKPCEGEPHARIDGGRLETERRPRSPRKRPEGKPWEKGCGTYRRATSPRQSPTFASLDDYLWKLTCKWARRSHPGKPRHWVTRRYIGQFNPSRRNKWVFGDAASGAYLPHLAWTPIIRHRKVTGAASPDDPALTSYWNQRRGRNQPPPDRSTLRLLQGAARALRASARTCSCTPTGSHTLPGNGNNGTAPPAKRSPGSSSSHAGRAPPDDTRLIHTYCERRATGTGSQEPAPSRT